MLQAFNPNQSKPYLCLLNYQSLAQRILGDSYGTTSSTRSSKSSTAVVPLTEAQLKKFSPELLKGLIAMFYSGETLRANAYAELKDLWEEFGKLMGSVKKWTTTVVCACDEM